MTEGPGKEETGTIVFDLDGTLCTNTFGEYEDAEPHEWAIERVNALAAAGHRIVILTARGTATGIDWAERTHAQLARWGVRYDELQFGKPSGDVFVDDRAVHTDSWRRGDAFLPPGFPLTADGGLPPAPAPHLPAVAEVGRTFAGEPLRLEQHARRAVELASAAGIAATPGPDELALAVREALADAGPAGEGDDLVFTISIAAAAHAALLDDWQESPPALRASTEVRVNRRRLGEAARALCPPLAEIAADGAPVVRAKTARGAAASVPDSGAPGLWPLAVGADGAVEDALGGTLALLDADRLVLSRRQPPDVAAAWAATLAGDAGLEVVTEPVPLDELTRFEEAAVVGMPFCLLPVAAIDGRELPGGAPGPSSARVLEAWSAEAGVDLPAQLGALAR